MKMIVYWAIADRDGESKTGLFMRTLTIVDNRYLITDCTKSAETTESSCEINPVTEVEAEKMMRKVYTMWEEMVKLGEMD